MSPTPCEVPKRSALFLPTYSSVCAQPNLRFTSDQKLLCRGLIPCDLCPLLIVARICFRWNLTTYARVSHDTSARTHPLYHQRKSLEAYGEMFGAKTTFEVVARNTVDILNQRVNNHR